MHHLLKVVPVVSKVLEKVVADQLGLFLESHHSLNNFQGTYCHGRSTEHIIFYVVDTIAQVLDNEDSVCAAFLDLRKTFDLLDHCHLLQRLFDLGISEVELTWFTDYLTHRLKCGVKFSDWGPVLGGIPQGSALGPLLFVIYVNNMPLQVSHSCL